jgi:ketosteroid isomerase-like protein
VTFQEGNTVEGEENMTLNVPPIVTEYLEAERAKDARRLSLCFADNAVVHDEGKDRCGQDAIREWKEEADAKYTYVSEPLSASVDENVVTVRARLTGDFPGSPLEVDQVFTLDDSKIVSLEIHS